MSPTEPIAAVTLDFPDALRAVMGGKSITKQEWDNPEIKVALHALHLSIIRDKGWQDLIVTDGDLFGTDWVVIDAGQEV